MEGRQRIDRVRRQYNQWVANQTLEDYALRFTAKSARRWSAARVANTALGAISFLALEAIGGTITLNYGATNSVAAILVVSVIIFCCGLPIAYHAARGGVDIDLLTRGAGFGYIGSTITSLIYASFTFIFFAIEAVILAMALELCFGIPRPIGYLLSAVVIIPLVTHGITLISRFQLWTQPIWVILHILPFAAIAFKNRESFVAWTQFPGEHGNASGHLDLLLFGTAASVVFSLVAQIGEQVDFLRFLPRDRRTSKVAWWLALLGAGPGWIVIGAIKLLAGSFLAFFALSHGITAEHAAEPTQMYLSAFRYVLSQPDLALALTGTFVILSQLKINVTNAYAGSIAWTGMPDELGDADTAEQAGHLDEIENELGVVGADVTAVERAQVGDAVDAAGVALLADDQDGQDRRNRLGDDGEIDAADPALEHRRTDDEGEDGRHHQDGDDGEGQAVERLPEKRQLGDLIPVHEIGNARRRLDLGVGDTGCLKLEEHRHAVTTKPEEHALPQAEDAAIAPAQHQPQRHKRVGQILGDQVEAEHIEAERQDHHQ